MTDRRVEIWRQHPFHGQVKLGRRWYDTRTHAFVQQDSVNIIGNPQRGNRYSYAADNPVNNVDPTGALAVTVGAKVCYYICIGGGYSWDAEGNSAPYVSVGVGNPGVDAGSSLSTGNVESGLSGEIGCSAGFARASVNTSGEVSGGWGTDFSSGECDASAVYTF